MGNKRIYIPFSSAKQILGIEIPDAIYCKAARDKLNEAINQAEIILSARRNGNYPFETRSAQNLFQKKDAFLKKATLVTASIGGLCLIVGGIGIMNILLASVQERIHEIGIRKSLGATQKDVLMQFLFESLLLSLMGGVGGLVIGLFASMLIKSIFIMPIAFSWHVLGIGVGFSLTIGLLFGIYPALQAAKLSPIDALRYE